MKKGIRSCRGQYSYAFTALLAAALALLIMLPSILRFGGVFVIRGDYLEQYLTRLMTLRRMMEGAQAPMWDWTMFLGSPHNNQSAFFSLDIVSLLVPERFFLPAVTLGHMLRFAIAAVTACMYLRIFVDRRHACLGGILYAFSSYALVALEFSQFNNALAVFPLLFWGIERLFTQKQYRHCFILAAALNAHLNFYLFIQSSIFLLVYALVRYFFEPDWSARKHGRYIVMALVEWGIGTMLAGVAAAQFVSIALNAEKFAARTGALSGLITFLKLLVPTDLLDVIVGFTSAGVSNRFDTFGRDTRWLSFSAWLPVFGSSLWLMYLYKHRMKTSIGRCLIVCLIITCLPLFNNAFNLYTAHYTRWWYCLVLLMVLASMLALQEIRQYDSCVRRMSVWLPLAALAGVVLLSECLIPVMARSADGIAAKIFDELLRNTGELDTERRFQLFSIGITLLGAAVTLVLYRGNLERYALGVCAAFVLLYGSSYVYLNNTDEHLFDHTPESGMTLDRAVELYIQSPELDNPDPEAFFRVDFPPQLSNFGIAHGYPAVNVFSSEVDGMTARAARMLGYENGGEDVRWWLAGSVHAVRTFLSVRYYFAYAMQDIKAYPIPDGFSRIGEANGVTVYENDCYLPMGFMYDSYCVYSEIDPEADMALLMLNTLVVDDEGAAAVQQSLTKWDETLLDVHAAADARRNACCSELSVSSQGLDAVIDASQAGALFFSIPYSENWSALVDGEPAELFVGNGGFTALLVDTGKHQITLRYVNPSLVWGVRVTLLGLLLLMGYLLIQNKGEKRERKTSSAH